MFAFLFRRGNPTNQWSRQAGVSLTVDLSKYAINSISVGADAEQFSFLGRSDSKSASPLKYHDLGLSLDLMEDGTVAEFRVVFADPNGQFAPFRGTILVNGSAINTGRLLKELGACYWIDKDEYEILHFFESPPYEIIVEQSLQKQIRSISVTNDGLMANPEQRRLYGVDKPWPPH